MITKITIKNFQSHKRTIIDLSKGINVFVGISDKGKTVIIRAIRWVVYNKPSGDEFRSWWGGDTEVSLTFSDGTVITRKKSNSENYYQINEDTPLKAFGQGVPEEVTKLLNLEDVNIQQQLDAPFLLSETAGEVAAHFNRVAGISIIDKSISKAKKEVAATKQLLKIREKDLEEKQEQYKKYENLDALETEVKKLDALEKDKKQKEINVFWLKDKSKRLQEINEELSKKSDLLQLEKPVLNILEKHTIWEDLSLKRYKLEKIFTTIDTVEEKLEQIEGLLTHEQVVDSLLNQYDLKVQKSKDLRALNLLIGKYTTLSNKEQEMQGKLMELQDLLPDLCPVCNGSGKLK